jgi:thiosulfate/3-mercaptopyruvate sulfurtransferase
MAINSQESALISTEELHGDLHTVRLIDASWYMPSQNRHAYKEYEHAHIKGAVFFDLDGASDHTSSLPHMLPTSEAFAVTMSRLGVSNSDDVVVYDTQGLFSAPRLWWMLRVFGHTRVRVLNGGLPAWRERYAAEIESGNVLHSSVPFVSTFQPQLVASLKQMQEWSGNGTIQICDARSPSRFWGKEPEPRAGLRSGHIPTARNLHYAQLLTLEQKLKQGDELRALFVDAGIQLNAPIVTSCGSGVTACILALALYEIGIKNVPVYDGSWAEWGAGDLPIASAS